MRVLARNLKWYWTYLGGGIGTRGYTLHLGDEGAHQEAEALWVQDSEADQTEG